MTKGSPWAKHCSGTVAMVYEKEASKIEDGAVNVLWERQSDFHKILISEPETSILSVNVDELYKNLDTIGMQYGPTFRNLVSLTAIPSKSASFG